ncbi:hypothetical protein GW923_02535 [Candidatus Pacearchaeota archaeon]|nr:hypothetical protein [Candidatus Pacearchaeota archaeon]OIO43372.1 MAG: hypothetical protein AUJ63_00590 [Candidatus Pacearchaeota archaeon CG1_02_35_32]
MGRGERKGLSPVVATVLLISIVIVLALIIFLWAKGFVSEKNLKFQKAIELSCDDVDFVADYVANSNYCDGDDEIGIVNQADVPIYGIIVKEIGPGRVNANDIFPDSTLNQGESRRICLEPISGNTEGLLVVPVLLGQSGSTRKTHDCDDSYGFVIPL